MSLYIFKHKTARALFCGVDELTTNVFPYYLPSVLLLLKILDVLEYLAAGQRENGCMRAVLDNLRGSRYT